MAGDGDGIGLIGGLGPGGLELAVVQKGVGPATTQGFSGQTEQGFGRAVGIGDVARGVDGQHAGEHGVEHRREHGAGFVFDIGQISLEQLTFQSPGRADVQVEGQGVIRVKPARNMSMQAHTAPCGSKMGAPEQLQA